VIAIGTIAGGGGSGEEQGGGGDAAAERESGSGSGEGSSGGAGDAEAGEEQVAAVPAPGPDPDPTRGSQLNQEGYSLLQSGDAEAAVPVLRRAVRSFPEGSQDLEYAYALFNLGRALRLSGNPEQAIPVLERRLTFNDQRPAVREELRQARAAAG
jgi:tetratricopeptide (TPR) repeat protein